MSMADHFHQSLKVVMEHSPLSLKWLDPQNSVGHLNNGFWKNGNISLMQPPVRSKEVCTSLRSPALKLRRLQKIIPMGKTFLGVRATSHTRLRAHDRYTSSTLIGGEGGAGPGLLHTTLEGPTEYVNARWM